MTEASKDQIVQQLIEDNQGLVYHIALRAHRGLPVRHELDDLVGNGMVGLAEAAKQFDPKVGVQFSTFAFFRIRGAIYDGLAKSSWMSRARYRRYLRNNKSEHEKSEEEAPESTDDGWSSGDSVVQELTSEHIEQISDDEPSAPTRVSQRETTSILCELVESLPGRERRLIQLVYFEGLSLQEAGDRLGVSKSWASRLHAKTIEKLGLDMKSYQGDSNEP